MGRGDRRGDADEAATSTRHATEPACRCHARTPGRAPGQGNGAHRELDERWLDKRCLDEQCPGEKAPRRREAPSGGLRGSVGGMSLLGSASCGGEGCAGLGQPLAPDLARALVEAPALVDDAEGKALLRAVPGHDVSINTPSDTYLPAERSSRSSAQVELRSTSSRGAAALRLREDRSDALEPIRLAGTQNSRPPGRRAPPSSARRGPQAHLRRAVTPGAVTRRRPTSSLVRSPTRR